MRDPELGRMPGEDIGHVLLSLRTRVDGAANSDADVGPKALGARFGPFMPL